MINHYQTLGLERTATQEEIKASYRQLVKQYHPDVTGGDAMSFANIQEAYEVLSQPARRERYDRETIRARPRPMRRTTHGHAPQGHAAGPRPHAAPEPGPRMRFRAPAANFTRVMSVALPGSAQLLIQGLTGTITVLPTNADNLWPTTLQKFGGEDRWRLARHVVQIKVTGHEEHVSSVFPHPTERGAQLDVDVGVFSADGQRERTGAQDSIIFGRGDAGSMGNLRHPMQLHLTVPPGISLFFAEVAGHIHLGDLEADVVARLGKTATLRAGRLARLGLVLRDSSRAHVVHVGGDADVMVFDRSSALVGGEMSRLRTVAAQQGQLEIKGTVGHLLGEVRGLGYVNLHGDVYDAELDVGGNGLVRIDRLHGEIRGTRMQQGKVRIRERDQGPTPDSPLQGDSHRL
jgi:hypothetical protein